MGVEVQFPDDASIALGVRKLVGQERVGTQNSFELHCISKEPVDRALMPRAWRARQIEHEALVRMLEDRRVTRRQGRGLVRASQQAPHALYIVLIAVVAAVWLFALYAPIFSLAGNISE